MNSKNASKFSPKITRMTMNIVGVRGKAMWRTLDANRKVVYFSTQKKAKEFVASLDK